jgi:Zn-dependent protease with chaperone function
LDAGVFEPSALAVETRQRIATRLQTVIDAHPQLKLEVHFRKGGRLGPNALALPDGTIIFTDEMCELAQDDAELVAVMAHEVGHVVHRHGLRMVIQDALLAFGVVALTGELSGSAELLVGLPVLFTELAYSREFEREADRYALSFLRTHRISPRHFAALMRRIDAQQSAKKPAGKNNQWMGYLSTHPLTEERLEAFDID